VGPPGGAGAAPLGAAGPSGGSGPSDDARLRGAARQLTGVFAQQLFKAMRATVPQGEGAVDGGSGEEMFTGLLDEHLAGAGPGARPGAAGGGAGAAWAESLADAVYRRMRPTFAPAAAPGAHPPNPAAVTPALDGASLGGASAAGLPADGPGAPARR
jgi:Rod binding domain-containing protein